MLVVFNYNNIYIKDRTYYKVTYELTYFSSDPLSNQDKPLIKFSELILENKVFGEEWSTKTINWVEE